MIRNEFDGVRPLFVLVRKSLDTLIREAAEAAGGRAESFVESDRLCYRLHLDGVVTAPLSPGEAAAKLRIEDWA